MFQRGRRTQEISAFLLSQATRFPTENHFLCGVFIQSNHDPKVLVGETRPAFWLENPSGIAMLLGQDHYDRGKKSCLCVLACVKY